MIMKTSAIIDGNDHPYCCGAAKDVNYVVVRADSLSDFMAIMEIFTFYNRDFEPCGGPFLFEGRILQAMRRKT